MPTAQTADMENLIATLFLARELAHREHLRTRSYAQHLIDEAVSLYESTIYKLRFLG